MNGKNESFVYKTSPLVCSEEMRFELEGDTIKAVEIIGGCPGNLFGISRLIEGMKVDEVIRRFEGISCAGKPTSCPDQIAQALKLHRAGK